ncbi:hypothetical protein [Paraburkholderia nemoris]|uniref:hypothetical protein n=1 Tax=Paraburkholderia nemoris TaxID=2793076 RepID=UPI001B1230B7|nr:hypothetical protein [Paraburkholderia nemoris]CAE6710740.1 hypothetical protein LMG22931_01257 [Paraburkholderia nemoris]
MGRRSLNTLIEQVVAETRNPLSLEVKARDIQRMIKDNLLALQQRVGLGSEWGVISFPEAWMPDGSMKSLAQRTLYLDRLMKLAGRPEGDVEDAIVTVLKYVLICFLVPFHGRGLKGVLLSPSTLVTNARRFCQVVEFALDLPDVGQGLLQRLDLAACKKLVERQKWATELARLCQLADRGYWSDVPPGRVIFSNSDDDVAGSPAGEIGETASNDEFPTASQSSNRFQPFSDFLVAEFGWRAAWFVNELEPALHRCFVEVTEAICRQTAAEGRTLDDYKRGVVTTLALESFEWRRSDGTIISELPFELNLRGRGRGRDLTVWPPRTYAHIKHLAYLCQSLHLIIFLLSTGGRISEMLSFSGGNILRTNVNGVVVDGRTYKLVFADKGAQKDWPLPDLAVRALVHQRELRHIAERFSQAVNNEVEFDVGDSVSSAGNERVETAIGSDKLWANLWTGEPIHRQYQHMIPAALQVLGVGDLLDGTAAHAHRFRKTIARLIALAVVGAPKILMDFFGHDSIEMTLSYILTDPDIRLEMEEVLKAQVIMMASDAIKSADECGGPAAEPLRQAVKAESARLGREFNEEDIYGLADTLTLSGKYWQHVRPGVICTKLPQQAGPCNKHRVAPEPASCRSYCGHRLELAAVRDDVDGAIEEGVAQLKRCEDTDDVIGAEMWRGQVLANLNRFPDLKEKWWSNSYVQSCVLQT